MLDGDELRESIVDGVLSVAKHNYNEVRLYCQTLADWMRMARFTLKDGKRREAVEWLDRMWEELGWGDFLEGVR